MFRTHQPTMRTLSSRRAFLRLLTGSATVIVAACAGLPRDPKASNPSAALPPPAPAPAQPRPTRHGSLGRRRDLPGRDDGLPGRLLGGAAVRGAPLPPLLDRAVRRRPVWQNRLRRDRGRSGRRPEVP